MAVFANGDIRRAACEKLRGRANVANVGRILYLVKRYFVRHILVMSSRVCTALLLFSCVVLQKRSVKRLEESALI